MHIDIVSGLVTRFYSMRKTKHSDHVPQTVAASFGSSHNGPFNLVLEDPESRKIAVTAQHHDFHRRNGTAVQPVKLHAAFVSILISPAA
jgi:hypothetical protein